jgi:hypothetical protein
MPPGFGPDYKPKNDEDEDKWYSADIVADLGILFLLGLTLYVMLNAS